MKLKQAPFRCLFFLVLQKNNKHVKFLLKAQQRYFICGRIRSNLFGKASVVQDDVLPLRQTAWKCRVGLEDFRSEFYCG
jgi:hypothetical protein